MLAAGWKLFASLALVLFIGGTVGSAVILEGVARTGVVSDEQGARLRPLHRYAAAAMTLVMAVTIALLEPLVAGAPWWTSGDGDLVGALAIPFGVWLSLALGRVDQESETGYGQESHPSRPDQSAGSHWARSSASAARAAASASLFGAPASWCARDHSSDPRLANSAPSSDPMMRLTASRSARGSSR